MNKDTFGFCPNQCLYGVPSVSELVGLLLCTYTAVVTASAQKCKGILAWNIIDFADSMNVQLSLSDILFCSSV